MVYSGLYAPIARAIPPGQTSERITLPRRGTGSFPSLSLLHPLRLIKYGTALVRKSRPLVVDVKADPVPVLRCLRVITGDRPGSGHVPGRR